MTLASLASPLLFLAIPLRDSLRLRRTLLGFRDGPATPPLWRRLLRAAAGTLDAEGHRP